MVALYNGSTELSGEENPLKAKSIFSTVLGNALELYDFILYGFLATFIAQAFFPEQTPFITLLLSFSVFATACIVRPFSALFFGKMGDTAGRKKSLLLSVNMMCVATFLVGILPSFHSIGIIATIALIILRLMQGFSVAGEETNAAVYLTEESSENNRGFMTSFVLASVHLGLLLGSIICTLTATLLTPEQMQAFGWRIPFLLALPFGILASYLRARSRESAEFERVKDNIDLKPIKTVFKHYRLNVAQATGVCSLFSVVIYLFTLYSPNYLQQTIGYTAALYLTTSGLLILCIFCPLFGHLSDRYGALRLFRISCILFALFSFPLFNMLKSGLLENTIIAYITFSILLLPLAGSLFAIIVKLFPISVRCTGVSFSFNLSFTLFGSSAPIIAHYLTHSSWGLESVALYIIATAIISFISTITIKEVQCHIVEQSTPMINPASPQAVLKKF